MPHDDVFIKYAAEWEAINRGDPRPVHVTHTDGNIYYGVTMGVEGGKVNVAWLDGKQQWHGDSFAKMFVVPAP